MALLALNIIFKKYKSVIKQWRIRIGGIHSSDISRSSAFAMAFNLGLTSMAKRPLRTSLIIIMVSLLVFSVNTFISVETYLDTKFVPIRNNAKQKYNGILYRQPNFVSLNTVHLCL